MTAVYETSSELLCLGNKVSEIHNHWRQTQMSGSGSDTLSNQTFILSLSDGLTRAKTVSFTLDGIFKANNDTGIKNSQDFEKAKLVFYEYIHRLASKFTQPIIWLRIEWVTDIKAMTWAAFQQQLTRYKRNYYRSGIAFKGKRQPWLLLTEMELNANACLYVGNQTAHAGVNITNLTTYLKARHGSSQIPVFTDDLPVLTFNTAGVFIDVKSDKCHVLETKPRNKGHRVLPPLSAENVQPIIVQSAHHLTKQVQPSGQYIYGHFPCFGRTINTYNSLRHASSTYALIEGYEACRRFEDLNKNEHIKNAALSTSSDLDLSQMKSAIDKAMDYLTHQLIQSYDNKAYVIDTNEEIKLGANAVAILAIVKYLQVFENTTKSVIYHRLAEQLALGIVAMQQEDGSFVHVLHSNDLTIKDKNRIIYYDGEAAFALMRLYGLAKDERWLDCVTRAFDYFIAAKHYDAHDHWLSYCSNELIIYKPEKKYFQFAVDNVKGYVDFIKTRITTFPTLLELSMAFHNMLMTLDDYPEFHEVLDGFDVQEFYAALHARANHLLNGFFFPEMAMFYKFPQTVLHGFFIRHHSFRVRIDDVEHYLSGLIAYQNFLQQAAYPKLASKPNQKKPRQLSSTHHLTADTLAKATQGHWLTSPPQDWFATGLCAWSPSFEIGQILVARSQHMQSGYLSKIAITSLLTKGGSAILTDDALSYNDLGVPVLYVPNIRQAILNIGQYSRQSFNGKVLGVTGSAGKTTTVNLLGHVLSKFGQLSHTKSSANLPVGVAWNLASMPQSSDYWILEMAIGSMAINTDLVRPDVAFITNIAPAHLEYHHSVENIALKKARIFEGMAPQSIAVVCRDIAQYELIESLARTWGVQIISYGEHELSTFKLMSYNAQHNQAQIRLKDKTYTISLQTAGKHMVLNAMAVLAVIDHFQLSIDDAISKLQTFKAVTGRGEVRDVTHQGIPITLYDEAYNANPLSMKAALDTFHQSNVDSSNKVVIIGDMLELGGNSQQYHLDLISIIKKMAFRELVLVGNQMRLLVDKLESLGIQVRHFTEAETLKEQLGNILRKDDFVLIKASNSMGLNKLF